MAFYRFSARRSVLSSVVVVAAVLAAPLTANAGFFEQLFGAPATQSRAVEQYEPVTPVPDSAPRALHRTHAAVERDEKPVLQKPTDLMHDKTLRAGDPVMMKDGIHIYSGPEAGHHNTVQFVALGSAHVPAKTRVALAAVDPMHRDPIDGAPMQEGRSVAGATTSSSAQQISAGYKITDVSGKSIRYVGP